MATTTSIPQDFSGYVHKIGEVIESTFKGIVWFFRTMAVANQCTSEIEILSRMSDQALAKRGLKRDDVANHVFDKWFGK